MAHFLENITSRFTPLKKTNDCLWPAHAPYHVKVWVDRFFQLLDGYSPEAAEQWAQLYAPDGVFEAFGQTFKGKDGKQIMLLFF